MLPAVHRCMQNFSVEHVASGSLQLQGLMHTGWKNTRTKVPVRIHEVVQAPTNTHRGSSPFKFNYTCTYVLQNKINLPLILMFSFSWLKVTKKPVLHGVNVCGRIEENTLLETQSTGCVNMNFVPAADSFRKARPKKKKEEKKTYP